LSLSPGHGFLFAIPIFEDRFGSGGLMRKQLPSTAYLLQGKCRRCGNIDGCKKK
jgi:hypothetical protein